MFWRCCVMSFRKSESAGYLANHLARLFANALTDEIAPLGLAPAQFMTLLELWERDGRTQAELVERLDVEQATLANTLKRMERDGLVARAPHPDDKRAQLIKLTPRAKAMEADAKAAAQRVNARALAGLDAEETAAFIAQTARIIANLKSG